MRGEDLTLADQQTVVKELVLQPGQTVRGRVIDAISKAPIPDAEVSAP